MSTENKKPAKAPAKPKKAAEPKTAAAKVETTKAAAKPKSAGTATKAAKTTTAAAKAAPVEASPVEQSVAKPRPTREQIAHVAYGYFLQRHGQHGHHEQDWFRAEQELLRLL